MIAYISSAKQGVNLLAITSKHLNEIYERPICSYRRSTELFQQMVDMEPCKPFPFLQLPKEVRLMIHEQFSIDIKEHNFIRKPGMISPQSSEVRLTLIDQTTPTAILATCRQLHHEARDIISSNLLELLKRPLHMILHIEDLLKIGRDDERCMTSYLLAADWMLSNYHTTLDSSNCPCQYLRLLGDLDCSRILPIARRWVQCIKYQQDNVCVRGKLPVVTLDVLPYTGATEPYREFANQNRQKIRISSHLKEIHKLQWYYDLRIFFYMSCRYQ
jgi:hypothetical protein